MGRKALSGVEYYEIEIYNEYNQLAKAFKIKGYYVSLEKLTEYLYDKVLAGEITIKLKPKYIEPPAYDYTPSIPMEGRAAEISAMVREMIDARAGFCRRR